MMSASSPIKMLYICYFGLKEPLVQTQVLPYLRQLAAGGIGVSLLTFEPDFRQRWNEDAIAAQSAVLAPDGIHWIALPYHKRPSAPATLYDILMGAQVAVRLVRRHKINVLHARAHIALAMALLAQRVTRCRLVFDIRGLIADEYADAGIWKENSPVFRVIKKLERAGIKRADQLVVLTQRMRDWLVQNGLAPAEKIEVIPCCVDFSRFDQEHNPASKTNRFEVIYAGAVNGLYLLEEMAGFFLALRERRPDAYLRILTQSSRESAVAVLKRAGINESDFWVGSVAPAEVPSYLRRGRLGLSFRKPAFSQIAASPTKVPEYLAAGLPVVSNAMIGDTDTLLNTEGVGVVLQTFDPKSYALAAERALALADDVDVPPRCMEVARRYFDLSRVGGAGYLKVYGRIKEQLALSGI